MLINSAILGNFDPSMHAATIQCSWLKLRLWYRRFAFPDRLVYSVLMIKVDKDGSCSLQE